MFVIAIFQKNLESKLIRFARLGLCLAIISGCTSVRPSIDLPNIATWDLRQEALGQLDDWEFRGRIAVKSEEEGFNGHLNWVQDGDKFFATVGGPLGVGAVKIKGDRWKVSLTDKDGIITVLEDPETELYLRYGWTVPINSFRYWVLGIEDPSTKVKAEVDEFGRLVSLRQNDWELKISRYHESAGQEMPYNLTVSNPDTRVRMVIDKWTFYQR
ncbi:MAG: lipoprotein insertase outer membrane protein LolB [Woeseiaceae bacterium]|nr:lipoprotein insertase outer membrane protein LolB [Woeseiaceae bacterium]